MMLYHDAVPDIGYVAVAILAQRAAGDLFGKFACIIPGLRRREIPVYVAAWPVLRMPVKACKGEALEHHIGYALFLPSPLLRISDQGNAFELRFIRIRMLLPKREEILRNASALRKGGNGIVEQAHYPLRRGDAKDTVPLPGIQRIDSGRHLRTPQHIAKQG